MGVEGQAGGEEALWQPVGEEVGDEVHACVRACVRPCMRGLRVYLRALC